MNARTVLIADDHPIFRRGLRALLEEDGRFCVIAEAGDGAAALELSRRLAPRFVLLDVSMPGLDGLVVLAELARRPRPPAVALLTMYDEYAQRAVELGASGYLLKENAAAEVVACLLAIEAGDTYVSPELRAEPGGPDALSCLSAAERRVVSLVAELKTSREIAELLCISTRTVQNHRRNACKKLGLVGDKALLELALRYRPALRRETSSARPPR